MNQHTIENADATPPAKNADNARYSKLLEEMDREYEGEQTRERLGILSADALSVALNVMPTTLAAWRKDRRGPPYTKPGKQVFYRLEDVRLWLDAFVVRP